MFEGQEVGCMVINYTLDAGANTSQPCCAIGHVVTDLYQTFIGNDTPFCNEYILFFKYTYIETNIHTATYLSSNTLYITLTQQMTSTPVQIISYNRKYNRQIIVNHKYNKMIITWYPQFLLLSKSPIYFYSFLLFCSTFHDRLFLKTIMFKK